MKASLLVVRVFLALLALLVVVGWSSPARAQQIELAANVDANEIELGDSVTYTLQATSATAEAPSDPQLGAHPGFTIAGQGASPTHMVSIINGHATQKHGLTASWSLRSDRLGTFTIGPATIAFSGIRRQAPAQRVSVVAPGQGRAKPRRPGRAFDPFAAAGSPLDPFKGIFPGVDDETSDPMGALNADPKLGLESPRAPVAFLHATLDKTRAVVGEQVTLTVYLYEDLHTRQGRPSDVHEATATEFVKRSLMQDETRATYVGNASVGGRAWSVKLVRKNALFPIKTGRLLISPMSLTLPQARVGLRESETLWVDVSDPPVVNRPAGYQLGDTGDFSLSASVTPRSMEQHGAIGVNVELRGSGNMPATLPTPEIGGVEWLEPQTRDSLGPVSNERFGGSRAFNYVVRVHKEGAVDLGEIRLPYYDPQTRSYNVARAALGIIQVAHSTGRDAGVEVAETILPGLPKPRAALEGKKDQRFLTERPAYWGALFGSPLACVAAIVFSSALRRRRERRATTAPTPSRIARDRRAEAESAMKAESGTEAVAAVARALEAEILASTGVNVRGTFGDGTLRELTHAGLPEDEATALLAVLSACEDARFSPSGVPIDVARSLWLRAKEAIATMSDHGEKASVPPPSKGSPPAA